MWNDRNTDTTAYPGVCAFLIRENVLLHRGMHFCQKGYALFEAVEKL